MGMVENDRVNRMVAKSSCTGGNCGRGEMRRVNTDSPIVSRVVNVESAV